MTAAQALRKLITEIDATCIRTGNDGDKILVALDQDTLDRYWQIAVKEEKPA